MFVNLKASFALFVNDYMFVQSGLIFCLCFMKGVCQKTLSLCLVNFLWVPLFIIVFDILTWSIYVLKVVYSRFNCDLGCCHPRIVFVVFKYALL